jgi:hypothetical protein
MHRISYHLSLLKAGSTDYFYSTSLLGLQLSQKKCLWKSPFFHLFGASVEWGPACSKFKTKNKPKNASVSTIRPAHHGGCSEPGGSTQWRFRTSTRTRGPRTPRSPRVGPATCAYARTPRGTTLSIEGYESPAHMSHVKVVA